MRDPVASFIVATFANATLLLQILILVFIGAFIVHKFNKKNKRLNAFFKFFSDNYLVFSFLISLIATVGSLMFSEIAHFTPCKLCWYQRIFMYPQAIIFGIAMIKNDYKVWIYGLVLSIIGGVIALYHVGLQWYPAVFLPCSDETANCAVKQFATYGYITIPVMSLTAFIALLLYALNYKKR